MDTGANISTMIIAFLSLIVSVILAVPKLLQIWRHVTARRRLRGLVPVVDRFICEDPSPEDVERLRNELDKLDIRHPHLPQFDLLQPLEPRMFYAYLRNAATARNLNKARAAYREAKKTEKEIDEQRLSEWREEHGFLNTNTKP